MSFLEIVVLIMMIVSVYDIDNDDYGDSGGKNDSNDRIVNLLRCSSSISSSKPISFPGVVWP